MAVKLWPRQTSGRVSRSFSGNETPDLLLTQADRAAYQAKQHGRGRYELAPTELNHLM